MVREVKRRCKKEWWRVGVGVWQIGGRLEVERVVGDVPIALLGCKLLNAINPR